MIIPGCSELKCEGWRYTFAAQTAGGSYSANMPRPAWQQCTITLKKHCGVSVLNEVPIRTLITGDAGFVGQHTLRLLPGSIGLSAHCPTIDIRTRDALIACLDQIRPDHVIHLAAQSFVPESFRDPAATFDVNFTGTLRLLEALQASNFSGRLLFVGTGDVYGLVEAADLPLPECRAPRPRNPYAVSKVAAEALCYQWSQTGPFEIVMARPFNHIGAGQSPAFAVSDFARQIAEIRLGRRAPQLATGNIDMSRDFTDVADVIRAYALLLDRGVNGEIYNVCSGVERTIRSIIERLLALSGTQVDIVTDPARFRPADQPRVCGDRRKLTMTTGWAPAIPFTETLTNLYTYWEKQIG